MAPGARVSETVNNRRAMNGLERALSTWFGCGYSPVAPGTVGTLGSVPLLALVWWADAWPIHVGVLLAVIAVGTWAARGAEKHWGRKDPGKVVIDETAGYLLSALFAGPAPGATAEEWAARLAATFLLFRGFDIVKPWPARRLERLPGSVGIMIDDLFAGLYALAAFHAGAWLWMVGVGPG